MTLIDAGQGVRQRLASFRGCGAVGNEPARTATARNWVRFVARLLGPIGFVSSPGSGCKLGSFFPGVWLALLIPALGGCGSAGDSPLVVATTWTATERTQIEAAYHESTDDRRPIAWVILALGEKLENVIDRRGGVDILLGGPASAFGRLEVAGRLAGMNSIGPFTRGGKGGGPLVMTPWPDQLPHDPRIDPDSFALAKSALGADGWPRGYEGLVRAAARPRTIAGGRDLAARSLARSECVAMVLAGPNSARATQFLQVLETRKLSQTPNPDWKQDARADELLADLLGAALVDALDELREADAALSRFGHPANAEAAIGERPPWPPASVAKLLADPNGPAMVETLLEQVAPDPGSRAWLAESWSRPKRPIDGALLLEIAGAADGRLALEPRFRAWLRGEWTAWTRQVYRRVARVAGGYTPS